MLQVLLASVFSLVACGGAVAEKPQLTTVDAVEKPLYSEVPCLTLKPHPDLDPKTIVANCLPDGAARKCFRYVEDDVATPEEATTLVALVEKGMAAAGSPPPPGPTIFDPSLGYVRFSGKTIDVYRPGGPTPPVDYTPDEFASFSRVFERIRLRIAAVAGVPGLMFTAPLFVTRLVGDETWEPTELHDAYFHAHVDGRSTPHYHYSGLLYLSTAGVDFDGGAFEFLAPSSRWNMSAVARDAEAEDEEALFESLAADDASPVQHRVLPRSGRFVAFTAGEENLHRVARVTGGRRYVFSMWFTCSHKRYMAPILHDRNHRRPRVTSPTLGRQNASEAGSGMNGSPASAAQLHGFADDEEEPPQHPHHPIPHGPHPLPEGLKQPPPAPPRSGPTVAPAAQPQVQAQQGQGQGRPPKSILPAGSKLAQRHLQQQQQAGQPARPTPWRRPEGRDEL